MAAGGPEHLTVYRHVRADGVAVFAEDYGVRVTIQGTGSIAGQTFAVELFDPTGAAVSGPTVAIEDAAARKVLATFTGLTPVLGAHRFCIFRTDAGARTETSRGVIWVADARKG